MDALEIKIFNSPKELQNGVADYIIKSISETVSRKNLCTISLSGGTTPRKIYEVIGKNATRKEIDWGSVHFFWGDERCVPPDDKLSNFRMVQESLFSRINIPKANVHRIKGEMEPEDSASEYEKELKTFFSTESTPRMDIMLLGLGDDTHTASLFPFNDVLKEDYRWAVAAHKEEGPSRVTLTLPVINNAGTIMFIVTGEKKAQAVYNVFFSSFHPDRYPAQAVKPAKGNLFWFIDKEAASLYLDQARKQK